MLFSIIMITISIIGIIFWILPQAWNRPYAAVGGKSDVIIVAVGIPLLLITLFI